MYGVIWDWGAWGVVGGGWVLSPCAPSICKVPTDRQQVTLSFMTSYTPSCGGEAPKVVYREGCSSAKGIPMC